MWCRVDEVVKHESLVSNKLMGINLWSLKEYENWRFGR